MTPDKKNSGKSNGTGLVGKEVSVISLLYASEKFGLGIRKLTSALKDKIKYYSIGDAICLDLEDVIKFKLESDPAFSGKLEEILNSIDIDQELRPYYCLEQNLDSDTTKIVLQKIFEEIYGRLPDSEKKIIGDHRLLYRWAMNLGVIEIRRPAYKPNGDNMTRYISKFIPHEKAEEIIYRMGVRQLEKAKDPKDAKNILKNFLSGFYLEDKK